MADRLARLRRLTIDTDPARADQGLDLAPRAMPAWASIL